MSAKRPFFYGWILLAVVWLCYGFGIAPAYVSWGFFAPEMIKSLGLSRAELGSVFGLFTFLYSAMGPVVGVVQDRIGIRWIMTLGFLVTACGMFLMSRAQSLADCYVAFGVLGGIGVGWSTIIPCSTLGQHWFVQWRARAIAVIFAAGGIVGFIVTPLNAYVLEDVGTWRDGWVIIAAMAAAMAVVAALFVRDTPEQLGLRPDGADPALTPAATHGVSILVKPGEWTAWQAIRTPQFGLLVLAGIAYAVPWNVVNAHGRLHLAEFGFEVAAAGAILASLSLMSTFGRLSGALGDWVPPQAVLAASLLIEGLGVGLMLIAETKTIAYLSVTLIGLGFGAAYSSVPVVFSTFFGRRAFGTTTGTRMFLTGIAQAIAPWLAGMAYDNTKSYTIPFLVLVGLTLMGAIAAALSRHPGTAPIVAPNPQEAPATA